MRAQKLELLKGLKKLCSGAVVFGFVTSAGGNVLHAVEGSMGQSTAKVIISIVIAILIPTIFGWMFEIATRIIFRKEAARLMKFIAFAGAAGISGITAWNSYFHQREAFSHFGDNTQAMLLPLAIDGLMIIGSVYLIELGIQIRDMEAFIASDGVVKKAKDEQPKPTTKPKDSSKRDRIAAILAQNPAMAIRDIATLADASYNYTHALVTELRKADGAELVSA
jgi:hypothetical protein